MMAITSEHPTGTFWVFVRSYLQQAVPSTEQSQTIALDLEDNYALDWRAGQRVCEFAEVSIVIYVNEILGKVEEFR